MRKMNQSFSTKTLLAAAAFAIAGGSLCTYVVRADDMKAAAESKMSEMKMGTDDKSTITPEESKMVTDRIDDMKEGAADPKKAKAMEIEMAKMMVMGQMSKMLADDPATKTAVTNLMDDANMKKVHDEAMKMATDPDQMKKLHDEIVADPTDMKRVDHEAIMMDMHQIKSAKGESMMDKMSDKMK